MSTLVTHIDQLVLELCILHASYSRFHNPLGLVFLVSLVLYGWRVKTNLLSGMVLYLCLMALACGSAHLVPFMVGDVVSSTMVDILIPLSITATLLPQLLVSNKISNSRFFVHPSKLVYRMIG